MGVLLWGVVRWLELVEIIVTTAIINRVNLFVDHIGLDLMKQLLDFLPILLFFIVYKFYLDIPDGIIASINHWVPMMELSPEQPSDAIFLATLVIIIATLMQVAISAIVLKKVEKMPLIVLALLLVFGGATLILKDALFIQWKPTVINWLFALVFFGSQWIGDKPLIQRMLGQAIEIHEKRIWLKLNLAWIAFFIVSGTANLIVAPEIDPFGLQFSEAAWVDFKLFGLMGMTMLFVIGQAVYLAKFLPDANKETD